MAKLDDLNLDPDHHTDDRWTLDKLRRAGYSEEWERDCRTCGDEITMYRRMDGKGGVGEWLLLDSVVLTPHRCEGR